MLVVDLETPGIERRDITMSTGSCEFAEVTFDNAEVPAENLVGARGQGWPIAMSMLSYERGPADMGWVARIGQVVAQAQRQVTAGEITTDDGQRRRLMQSWVGLQVLQWHVQRTLASRQYAKPGPEGSIDKLLATRVEQEAYRTITDLAGPAALIENADMFSAYLYSRAQSIYGGTQQIQRSIVAQRLLGLPRNLAAPQPHRPAGRVMRRESDARLLALGIADFLAGVGAPGTCDGSPASRCPLGRPGPAP